MTAASWRREGDLLSWEADDPLVDYYDSDYPWPGDLNWPSIVERMPWWGMDVPRYVEIARQANGPVLEFCCGTGRVTVPMAEVAPAVTAVDLSAGMLRRFRDKIAGGAIDREVAQRIVAMDGDITAVDLPQKDFAAVALPYNGLMAIPSADGQAAAIRRAFEHLRPGGTFVFDLRNGYLTAPRGFPVSFTFERTHVLRKRQYMKFSGMKEMDAAQRQRLYGWYDEMDDDSAVHRRLWEITLRVVFPSELRLMLQKAGFEDIVFEGGYARERFHATSEQLLAHCVKPAR